MSAFTILPEHVQDSPEWHEARRATLGASEVAAVIGLSPWQTPLSVWRTKVLGEINNIDPETAWNGHAMESVIADWITRFRPEIGVVSPGISVASTAHPWLSASPDRITYGPDGLAATPIPIELKTSRMAWPNGVPDAYRVQSIVQQGVLGAPFGWVVARLDSGPERFAVHRVEFDENVWEQITRLTGDWWQKHIVNGDQPEPTTTAEALSLWPGDPDVTIEGDERLHELWEAYGLMQAEAVEIADRLDAVKLEFQKAMGDAVALTYQGRELFTWKPRAGARRFDDKALLADDPTTHAKYMRQGPPTRTFLRKTTKEVEG